MSDNNTQEMMSIMTNFLFNVMSSRITVPTDFHDQNKFVDSMMMSDCTGLVQSLTDLMVSTANTNIEILTGSEKLNEIYKEWMATINKDLQFSVDAGLKTIAKEYYSERWKRSSFIALKILKWGSINGYLMPTSIALVDGNDIYSKENNETSKVSTLGDFNYFIGQNEDHPIKPGNYLIRKIGCRWTSEYPIPFLIRRGVVRNYKLIELVLNREGELLDQLVPYLFSIKKGSEQLLSQRIKTYTPNELKEIRDEITQMLTDLKNNYLKGVPYRVSNFDEQIEHIIPQISELFKKELFANAEKHILSGLGFVDIANLVSSNRQESVLNPKAFIEEVISGVSDWKSLLFSLILLIHEKNKGAIKYNNSDVKIISSPIRRFTSEDDKDLMRSLFDRGLLSVKTMLEMGLEVSEDTERYNKEKEIKSGSSIIFYPPVIRNDEGNGIDIPGNPEEIMKDKISEDKKGIEKDNFESSKLEVSYYESIEDIDSRISKHFDDKVKTVFMKAFNGAWNYYKKYDKKIREQLAFKIAWSQVKKMSKKNPEGIWELNEEYSNKIEKATINEDKIDLLSEMVKEETYVNLLKKNELIDKLLKKE